MIIWSQIAFIDLTRAASKDSDVVICTFQVGLQTANKHGKEVVAKEQQMQHAVVMLMTSDAASG